MTSTLPFTEEEDLASTDVFGVPAAAQKTYISIHENRRWLRKKLVLLSVKRHALVMACYDLHQCQIQYCKSSHNAENQCYPRELSTITTSRTTQMEPLW